MVCDTEIFHQHAVHGEGRGDRANGWARRVSTELGSVLLETLSQELDHRAHEIT